MTDKERESILSTITEVQNDVEEGSMTDEQAFEYIIDFVRTIWSREDKVPDYCIYDPEEDDGR